MEVTITFGPKLVVPSCAVPRGKVGPGEVKGLKGAGEEGALQLLGAYRLAGANRRKRARLAKDILGRGKCIRHQSVGSSCNTYEEGKRQMKRTIKGWRDTKGKETGNFIDKPVDVIINSSKNTSRE